MVFVDRSSRTPDRFLIWKVRLFAIGATLGLAGMFMDQRAMIWGAIGVLVVGFLLRFLPHREGKDGQEGEHEERDPHPHGPSSSREDHGSSADVQDWPDHRGESGG